MKGKLLSLLFLLLISTLFPNSADASSAAYTEKVESVSYNWGLGGPNGLVDNFKAVFDQSQNLTKGNYFVQTMADDGVQVDFNGKRIIDRPKYSYSTLIDRALLLDVEGGNHDISTTYYEGIKSALIFSHVVKLNDWLAYYYPNSNLASTPTSSAIVHANSDGRLNDKLENVPLANKDFSATYVTAKNLSAGNYVLSTNARKGIQVYIDGKLVLDDLKSNNYMENAIKVTIKDRVNVPSNEKSVHWIEVRQKNLTKNEEVDLLIQPYNEAMVINESDGWVGEVFSNKDFTGNSIILGGKSASRPIENLNFNWGAGSPHPVIPNDYFSAVFQKKHKVPETGLYKMKVWADDTVRVYVDGSMVIDSWKYIPGSYREITIPLTKGTRNIRVEYSEGILNARLQFELVKTNADFKEPKKSLAYSWGDLGPVKGKYDHFTAEFDQSQYLEKGDYFIQTRADDGIIMDINGSVKIDRWNYSSNIVDRAFLLNTTAGNHQITTLYNDKIKAASIYSDIVKFGDWLAYYYPNTNWSGTPITSKVIKPNSKGDLVEVNGLGSPVPGVVPVDHFTTTYVTAKRIPAGDYVFKLGADDGAQVFVDGKLVLDRLTPAGYREDAVKVNIQDNQGANKDIHWIEVKYKEGILSSRVDFSIEPYKEYFDLSAEDGWVGEVYPNNNFSGTPVILGGTLFNSPINQLDYNWGQGSPSPLIPVDNFSIRFKRKVIVTDPGYYVLNAWADDGVRVFVNGAKYIDSWKYNSNHLRQAGLYLDKGEHEIVIEHYEGKLGARLKFDLTKAKTHYSAKEKSLQYNWGEGSPHPEVQPDHFTAEFDQSQYLEAGDYFVQTLADDGISVEFNGAKIIDRPKYSYESLLDRAILPNVKAGNQKIVTNYFEGIKSAYLFSDVVKFGDWLAYYYPNQTLSGIPIATKVVPGKGKYGELLENNGNGSPVPGVVPVDNFSAKYVSAKRIPAGDYVLRTGADDGVQVYLDGKLILDRFTNGGFREDSVRITIADRANAKAGEQNVHWIEVRYKEASQASKIHAFLQPYKDAANLSVSDGWIGEFYSNRNLTGNSVIMGGKDAIRPLHTIDFAWGTGSPSPLLPNDDFSARFTRKINVSKAGAGYYNFSVSADDGVRIKVRNEKTKVETLVIDSWKYEANKVRQNKFDLVEGEHTIIIEYYEGILAASLKFELNKLPIVTNYTRYNYSFAHMVDKQMAGTPKSDGAGNISATRQEVEYYANPSNFVEGTKEYFQYLVLSRPVGLNAKEVNENVLYNKGNLKGQAQAFIDAGREYNINEAYLIAHALHETGNGRSTLATGIPVDKNGKVTRDSKGNMVHNSNTAHTVYNMYGYGAYDSCPIDCGAEYAFKQGWFTKSSSIIGGARSIYNYINRGQDTLYKMRWNPVNPGYPQYATHVAWATLQTGRIHEIYQLLNNYTLVYDIPQFNNQPPKTNKPSNSGSGTNTTPNSSYPTGVYGITNTGSVGLNFRDAPNTNASTKVIDSIPHGTRIEILGSNGAWINAKYNGKTGWVSSEFVDLQNLLEVTVSSLNVRAEARASSATVGSVKNGDLLTAVLSGNKAIQQSSEGHIWYQISYNGQTAWISGGVNGTEYIKVK